MAEPRIFQLADDTGGGADPESPFIAFGYHDNPFPSSGVSAPLYTAHMLDELRQINRWLNDVQQATRPEQNGRQPVPPLALRGALGVGKTHLLRSIEGGLQQYARYPVLRRNLADEGMTRLLLANLLLTALPNMRQTAGSLLPLAAPSSVPLLDEIVEKARSSRGGPRRRELLGVLDDDSQLKAPLQRILEADASHEADLRRWFALWLTRGTTSPNQRGKLGLSSPLEGEGQAIRAVADLMRLARKLELLQVWFVLIDQFEELWRPQVITEGRAARFLTDVRVLIDDALEGAPVAVLLAWNTKTGTQSAEDELAERYRALWQRLNLRVNLPGLREQDLWSFAAHYLKSVASTLGIPGAESQQKQFSELLQKRGLPLVRAQLTADPVNAQLGAGRYAQRMVLQAWRDVAIHVAEKKYSAT